MLSRKYYQMIADALAAERSTDSDGRYPDTEKQQAWYDTGYDDGKNSAIYQMSCKLCDVFEQDNPNFDRARFLKACGIEQ